MVSVTRRMLEEALTSGNAITAQNVGKIIDVTMGVSRYVSPTTTKELTFDISGSPISIGTTARAGELVLVQARGQYGVKQLSSELIDERGYSSDRRSHHYNLDDFPDSIQAGAIAYAGPTPLFVGSCAGVVASIGGEVRVGINDSKPEHNNGTVAFKTWVVRPTLDQ